MHQIILIIVYILSIISLFFLNAPVSKQHKQYVLPLFLTVLTLTALSVVLYFSFSSEKVLNSILSCSYCRPWFESANTFFLDEDEIEHYKWFIVDLFFLFCYIVVKFLFFATIRLLPSSGISIVASKFYHSDDKLDISLKEEYSEHSLFLYTGSILLAAISILLLIEDRYHYLTIFPVLLFLESAFFLEPKRKWKEGRFYVEDLFVSDTSYFSSVYQKFLSTFKSRIILKNPRLSAKKHNLMNLKLRPDLEEEVEVMKEYHPQFVSENFFYGINRLFNNIDKGRYENIILTNTPDYQVKYYLRIIINYLYQKDLKVLFLVINDTDKLSVLQYIDDFLQSVIFQVLDVQNYDKKENQQVVVATFEEMHQDMTKIDLEYFKYIFILDFKNILRTFHYLLNRFIVEYNERVGFYPRIVAVSNIVANEMEKSINQLLLIDTHETIECTNENEFHNSTSIVTMKSEGDEFQSMIGLSDFPHIGKEVAISYWLWKEGVPRIYINSEFSPIDEELEQARNIFYNNSSVLNFFENSIEIVPHRFIGGKFDENSVLIVTDNNNLPQTIKKWKHYFKGNELFLTVLSKPYLFRGYFLKHIDYFQDTRISFEIYPCGSAESSQQSFLLLTALSTTKLREDKISLPGKKVVTRESIVTFLNRYSANNYTPENVLVEWDYEFGENGFQKVFYFSLIGVDDNILDGKLNAKIIDENNTTFVIGTVHSNELFHKYLPNMIITHNSKPYMIKEINENKNQITAQFFATENIPFYTINKIFSDINKHLHEEVLNHESKSLKLYMYYSIASYICTIDSFVQQDSDKKVNVKKTLRYNYKPMLQIVLERDNAKISDESRTIFAFVFHELLKSLFPKNYYILDVVPVIMKERNYFPKIGSNEMSVKDNQLSICIFESSKMGLNLVDTIKDEQVFKKILILINHFLKWASKDVNALKQLKQISSSNIISTLTDVSKLITIVTKTLEAPEFSDTKWGHTLPHYCDFCAQELEPDKYEVLSDGRERCFSCKVEAVKENDKATYEKIYNTTKNYLQKRYDISFTKDINVKIVNADTLHMYLHEHYNATNEFNPRVVGIALQSDNQNEIIIENAAPIFRIAATIAHELTHIWQYENIKSHDTKLGEGHAMWVELEYIQKHYPDKKAYIDSEKLRTDIYGDGLRAIEAMLEKEYTKKPKFIRFIEKYLKLKKENPFKLFLR